MYNEYGVAHSFETPFMTFEIGIHNSDSFLQVKITSPLCSFKTLFFSLRLQFSNQFELSFIRVLITQENLFLTLFVARIMEGLLSVPGFYFMPGLEPELLRQLLNVGNSHHFFFVSPDTKSF